MQKLEEAIWVARALFERGRVAGSAANMSFRDGDKVYITRSGSCFGTLVQEDFSVIDLSGALLKGSAPSKEYPLHLMLYNGLAQTGAVLHTHSLYATLWSCLAQNAQEEPWPTYTPYLRMRLGSVRRVPYAKPGSAELFENARNAVDGSRAYLLENHGPVVAAKDMMNAFYDLEELEESAHVAWLLRGTDARTL